MEYRITDKSIGKGSFGKVFLAQDKNNGEWLAVKSIDKTKLSPRLLQSIWNEIQMMKKIQHPNIIQLYNVQDSPDKIQLFMEFCNLGDLSQFIRVHKGKNPLDGIPMFYVHSFLCQISNALQIMRHLNLIHRDLKPSNVLLSCKPLQKVSPGDISSDIHLPITLKLGDFGFARVLNGDDMAETLCGSPLYMAPEILRYEKYDAKADLWSVGIILYEMITGRVPFRAKNHMALIKKIQITKNVLFPDEMQERRVSMQSNINDTLNTRNSSPIRIPQNGMVNRTFSQSYQANTTTFVASSLHHPASKHDIGIKNEISLQLRELTRSLLKKDPLERIGFEEFFLNPSVRTEGALESMMSKLEISSVKENTTQTLSTPASLPTTSKSFIAQTPKMASNLQALMHQHHQKTPPPSSLPDCSPVSNLSISQYLPAPQQHTENRLKRADSSLSLASSKSQAGAPFIMDDIDSPKRISNPNSRRPSVQPSHGHQISSGNVEYPWSPSVPGVLLPFANPAALADLNPESQKITVHPEKHLPSSYPHAKIDYGVFGYVANSLGAVARVVQGGRQGETSPGDYEATDDGEYVVLNPRKRTM